MGVERSGTAAHLTIDLGGIVANWRDLCAVHSFGAVGATVKADAYGLGAARVGPALRDAGCGHFFVAQLAEGIALRSALGPGPVIAVLNGFPPGADDGAALLPVLNGLPDVEAWTRAAREDGASREVLLHLDTGMSRLGLDDAETARVLAEPALLDGLCLRWLMTHLACADTPDHPLNALQVGRFAAMCACLPRVPRSLSNSAGVFLNGLAASDLARPGCALYGINPVPGRPNPMRQVVRLDAPVLQVREIPGGAAVGYGASWKATRPSRIATVAAGYADGYLRTLSGRGAAHFRGRSVPLVGRVSMDLITFDVTDHPDMVAGDRIVLIGPQRTPDDLAVAAGTIGYEVLTSLGSRYARDWLPA